MCKVDDTQIDTPAGEHLTGTPPVAVSPQQEELVVGKEEVLSEVVPTNEPMEKPCEKVVRLPAKQKH
jgi:hypothetical protein